MKLDKETKVILSWFGVHADSIDFEIIYSNPKFWMFIIIVSIIIGLIAVLW